MRIHLHRTGALVAVASVAAVLGAAAPAGAQALGGTVVHHNRHAHSFVIATRGGALRAIHARSLPGVGRTVHVEARALRNGTFVAHRVHVGARRRRVRLHGTVSFADRRTGRFVLSSDGVSLLLRTRRGRGAHAANTSVPAPGTTVNVEAELPAGGTPTAQTVTPTGADFTIHVEGTVLAVDETARTITLSADDDEQSGAQLTISVPAAIDLTTIAPGQEVELLVALRSDGTYALLGIAGDDGAKQADDQGDEQGQPCGGHHDASGDQNDQNDQGGQGGDRGDGGSGD
jgi:hypothetical protein